MPQFPTDMTKVIALFNMKGGVAKTTTAYNLATGLVKFKNRQVLPIDIDPQGNASAALMASHELVIPVDMSYLGLLGVQGIEYTMSLVREQLDHPLEINGVLATRYDRRNNLSKEVLEALKTHFGDSMFKTIVPKTVKIREAPSHGQSIFEYDPNGIGAKAYQKLVEEIDVK